MASKRRLRRIACVGKRSFSNERTARWHAEHTRLPEGESLVPYQCDFCRQWHNGHDRRGLNQAIAERRRSAAYA